MNIIKSILIGVIGIFGTYVLFRVIVLAIATSWKQVMHPDIKNPKQIANNNRERRKENKDHEK